MEVCLGVSHGLGRVQRFTGQSMCRWVGQHKCVKLKASVFLALYGSIEVDASRTIRSPWSTCVNGRSKTTVEPRLVQSRYSTIVRFHNFSTMVPAVRTTSTSLIAETTTWKGIDRSPRERRCRAVVGSNFETQGLTDRVETCLKKRCTPLTEVKIFRSTKQQMSTRFK